MSSGTGCPIAGSYWVEPGRLLVGPYPSAHGAGPARAQLERLLDAGIRSFINLMHEDARGLLEYEPLLREIARERAQACSLQRFEIEDCSVPTPQQMDGIVRAIERAAAEGRAVYAHCWGGRGRAGIVAGVFLIRGGRATPANVREVIARLRGRDPIAHPSPETDEQLEFVRSYSAAR